MKAGVKARSGGLWHNAKVLHLAANSLLAFALLRRLHPVRGLHAEFLLLGVGFTLVESSSIVRLALLFGSTWVVNVVVFAASVPTSTVARTRILK